MARFSDAFLEIDAVIAEGGLRLSSCRAEGGSETYVVVDNSHAPSAAPSSGFYHEGIPYFGGVLKGFGFIFDGAPGAGHDADACLLCQLSGLDLVAEQPHGLDGWADKGYAALFADLCEVDVFGKEAIAWMNGVDVGDLGGTDDAGDIKITFGWISRADTNGFVGETQIGRFAVGFGIDDNGLDAELPAGPDNPQSYFAAVGDENF
jgi:hypothetical protein